MTNTFSFVSTIPGVPATAQSVAIGISSFYDLHMQLSSIPTPFNAILCVQSSRGNYLQSYTTVIMAFDAVEYPIIEKKKIVFT
jgi:hypothetical protein